jgi:hypothetical protein
MNPMSRLLNVITLALLVAVALPAAAQTIGLESEPIRVRISPQAPEPGQTVTITVEGIGTFLGDATITWRKDGVVAKSGFGERSYSFVAGPLGKLMRIDLSIDSPTQGVITRTFNFKPSTINLVWEADTTVPPFYRGKALLSPGSTARITAFPQVVSGGKTLSATSLSYRWKRGGEAQSAQSGKGKRTFTYTSDQLQGAESITVDVYLDNVLVGQGAVTIPVSDPAIVLYQRDPLRGVLWSEALPGAVSLNAKEITVQAVPYFFASDSFERGEVAYEWSLNGRETSGPLSDEGIMTLRQTGEGSGQALLGVELQNTSGTRLLQSAEAMVRMFFGAQSNDSSFFGL